VGRGREPLSFLRSGGKMCDPRMGSTVQFPRSAVCSDTPGRFQGAGFMKIIRSKTFTAPHAWGAIEIANMKGITTRLHWTDEPYEWHVNDGEEVFAVLDGRVEMRYREGNEERSTVLETGDVFYAQAGIEHVAHPIGEARVLVVETAGSV
jgi:mannose-6-phosphate isomerase-like protein (cupin superfamily)